MAVKWGIISTARINELFLADVSESDRVEVAAVASRQTAVAERYARERGIDRAYGSYEALLDDTELEAVYVSLPNALHLEWSIRALQAGKHVLAIEALYEAAAGGGSVAPPLAS